ncbi:MAG: hypothetical protein HY615_00060 [Candidatus Rokubacteria bacterium]|nr:hypothetical protein [Candidatus Rokubacteria bacterium]
MTGWRFAILCGCVAAVALASGRAEGSQPGAQLVVVGAIVREGGAPLAVIQDRSTGKTAIYRIGDLVAGGRVLDISARRVLLDYQGAAVELRLAISPQGQGVPTTGVSRPPKAAAGESDEVPIPRIRRDELARLGRAPELVHQASPLGDTGVWVREVLPGGLFDALGVRRGDVIRDVNGLVPGATLTLTQALTQAAAQPSQMLRVHFERAGQMDSTYVRIDP